MSKSLSLRKLRPVISQSIHTRGPSLKLIPPLERGRTLLGVRVNVGPRYFLKIETLLDGTDCWPWKKRLRSGTVRMDWTLERGADENRFRTARCSKSLSVMSNRTVIDRVAKLFDAEL